MEMFTLDSVRQLLKRNIHTELLCYENSRLHTEALKAGITVHLVSSGGYFLPSNLFRTALLIRRNRYDLIHTQASKDLWILVPALKTAGSRIPLILTKQVGSFIVKKDLLHRFLYNRLTLALAISNVIRTNLLDTTPLKKEKVELLHNSVDTRRFDPAKTDTAVLRRQYSIADDEIAIGMLARFSPGKGHEEFLSAAQQLLKKYSRLRFVIVGEASRGEDQYAADIRQMAASLGISDRVIFTGFRSDIPEVLASLDIFAFPSHSEAFGIALIEAMAMGKPSVCSASDGILDIALDGITSYLFRKQDSADFAEKLDWLIASQEKRTAFGAAARQRAVDHFDTEILTDQVVDIYKRLINTK